MSAFIEKEIAYLTSQRLGRLATPEVQMRHRPAACGFCQCSLDEVEGQIVERRQVQDVPKFQLVVTEPQVEAVRCPRYHQVTRGMFPSAVCAPAQYGPQVRALAVYLNQDQLLPEARTGETLADLLGCTLSDGTVVRWVHEAAERLAPTVAVIADLVVASRIQHADETGVRIAGQLHWLHLNSTRWLTHLAWPRQRGQQALETIGILPRFRGWAIHDRWASYARYACLHCLCKAHLLRDLTFLAEEAGQVWAADTPSLTGWDEDGILESCTRLSLLEACTPGWYHPYHELHGKERLWTEHDPAPGACSG